MKLNDDITQSIAATVSDVLEGKAPTKKEEAKYPHDMFHPKTGEKVVAKTPEDHEKLNKKGYTHEKPKLDEVEQPKAKGEKEFKKMHDDNVEVSGESPDGEVTKAKKGNYYKEETKTEESEKQAKYKKFFDAALKKFGVSSPAELEGDKKKEFFDYVDKNYEATDESVKEDVRDMKNFKDRNRKGFEARAFIKIEKGNTSNKFDDDFGFTKAELVQMDKLISKIKGMHVSSFDGGSSAPASLEFYGDKSSLDKFAKDRNVLNIAKKYKTKVEVFTNK